MDYENFSIRWHTLFGRKLVENLLADNHEVTIVTRGMSENPFGDKVAHIKVDRRDAGGLSNRVSQ